MPAGDATYHRFFESTRREEFWFCLSETFPFVAKIDRKNKHTGRMRDLEYYVALNREELRSIYSEESNRSRHQDQIRLAILTFYVIFLTSMAVYILQAQPESAVVWILGMFSVLGGMVIFYTVSIYYKRRLYWHFARSEYAMHVLDKYEKIPTDTFKKITHLHSDVKKYGNYKLRHFDALIFIICVVLPLVVLILGLQFQFSCR